MKESEFYKEFGFIMEQTAKSNFVVAQLGLASSKLNRLEYGISCILTLQSYCTLIKVGYTVSCAKHMIIPFNSILHFMPFKWV